MLLLFFRQPAAQDQRRGQKAEDPRHDARSRERGTQTAVTDHHQQRRVGRDPAGISDQDDDCQCQVVIPPEQPDVFPDQHQVKRTRTEPAQNLCAVCRRK